jgi:hypothetical protein
MIASAYSAISTGNERPGGHGRKPGMSANCIHRGDARHQPTIYEIDEFSVIHDEGDTVLTSTTIFR